MPPGDEDAHPRPIAVAAPLRERLIAEVRLVKPGKLFFQPPLVAAVVRQGKTRKHARREDDSSPSRELYFNLRETSRHVMRVVYSRLYTYGMSTYLLCISAHFDTLALCHH